jgi:hypothetical protein
MGGYTRCRQGYPAPLQIGTGFTISDTTGKRDGTDLRESGNHSYKTNQSLNVFFGQDYRNNFHAIFLFNIIDRQENREPGQGGKPDNTNIAHP